MLNFRTCAPLLYAIHIRYSRAYECAQLALHTKHIHSLQKCSTTPPSIDTSPLWSSPLFILFPNPPLLARLFRQYRSNEIQDEHKNKLMW